MTTIALLPLLSYVLVSSFTPGPANISSSSQGVRYGFRRTLGYMGGLGAGVFLMMLAGGLISASVMVWFPAVEGVLRFVGAAYILYLAWVILRSDYTFAERETRPLGFGHGVLLQLSNPKLMVYALTVFATFLTPLAGSAAGLIVAALLLAAVSVLATAAWALFGAGIKTRLHDQRLTRWLNLGLALLLIYAAIDLTGLLGRA